MRPTYLAILLASVLASVSAVSRADDLGKVVMLYSHKNHDTVAIGTGYFVSATGIIVTAYHLVEGAHLVQVFSRNGHRSRS